MHVDAACLHCEGGLDYGAGLHLGDFGIGDAETATAVTEHRVEFLECVNLGFHFSKCDAHLIGEFFLSGRLMRYEFMQRGIEKTDCYTETVHCFEDAFEVAALYGEKFGESGFAAFEVGGKNHFANSLDAVAFEEHVFGAAQTDALCAECACLLGIAGGIGVGAHKCVGIF